MKKVYMAGPIQHAQDNGKGWRSRVKHKYDHIDWVDPIDKYDSTSEAAAWEDEKVVEQDKALIDDCDAMLVHYEKVPTWGTPREHEYAVQMGIPVVVQTTEDKPSPWLTSDAVAVVKTFAEAVEVLQKPFSAADPRPNGEPYYIDTECDCGEDLVLYDSLTDEQLASSDALASPGFHDEENWRDDWVWHDEWVCPECLDGVHLDHPRKELIPAEQLFEEMGIAYSDE